MQLHESYLETSQRSTEKWMKNIFWKRETLMPEETAQNWPSTAHLLKVQIHKMDTYPIFLTIYFKNNSVFSQIFLFMCIWFSHKNFLSCCWKIITKRYSLLAFWNYSDFVFDPDNANGKPTLTLMPLSVNRLWNELCKITCMKGSTEGYLPV